MPQRKTPSKVLELRGAFKKHPERRTHEPQPAGEIGAAPEHLGADERAAWAAFVADAPQGVLASSDRLALEILVRLLVGFRRDPEGFPAGRMRELVSLLGRFGYTPSDRARLSVPVQASGNPFADL